MAYLITKMIQKKYLILLYLISFITIGVWIYIPTINDFSGDSYEYFGIAKDVYLKHGNYFNWTTAAGYSLWSLNYLITLVVGSFTFKSPIIFFLIINLFEIVILWVGIFCFYNALAKLFKINYKLNLHICLPFYAAVIGLDVISNGFFDFIFATDLFLILYDGISLLMLAWLLKLLISGDKTSRLQYWLFWLISFYLCVTNLRYCSLAIAIQIISIWLLYLQFHDEIKFKAAMLLKLTMGLIVIAFVGYLIKGVIDVYPADAFYFYPARLDIIILSFKLKLFHYLKAIWSYNIAALFLHGLFWCGIIIFLSLSLRWCYYCARKKKAESKQLGIYLSMLVLCMVVAAIVLVLISRINIFVGGNFLGLRYFELCVIFVFIGLFYFVITRLKMINIWLIVTLLTINCFSSIIYVYTHIPQSGFPYSTLAQCVKDNYQQNNLENGLGEYWTARLISAQVNQEVYPFMSDNPINTDFLWLSSLAIPPGNFNYLVYHNRDYLNRAMNRIYSLLPDLKISKSIDCGKETGIVVFSATNANYLTQLLKQEMVNYSSWSTINTMNWSHLLWQLSPLHRKFILSHNFYYYQGALLFKGQASNDKVKYKNNSDFSVTVNYPPSNEMVLFYFNKSFTYENEPTVMKVVLDYSATAPFVLKLIGLHGESFQSYELSPSQKHNKTYEILLPANRFSGMELLSLPNKRNASITIYDVVVERAL